MRILSALAPKIVELDDDQCVSDELVGRLLKASEAAVFSLLDQFSPVDRANLAVFCYRKAHLNRVGLAIAATCDRDTLISAWGVALGGTLYAQSREAPVAPRSVGGPQRVKVTLARRLPFDPRAFELAQDGADEMAESCDAELPVLASQPA